MQYCLTVRGQAQAANAAGVAGGEVGLYEMEMPMELHLQSHQKGEKLLIPAMCFGLFFGVPFIAWGMILIFDRDRSWQKRLQRSDSTCPPHRTWQWDRRQILYGTLLVAFGIMLFTVLSFFNYLAQNISPPAPF